MEFARRLRASMEAFAAGDPSATLAIWDPRIRWYAVARNPLAGKYVGHEAVLGYLAELDRLSGGTFRSEVLEVRPMFAETYVGRFHNRATCGGARLDVFTSLIIDGEGGKVTSVVEAHDDEAAWDRFWTAAVTKAGGAEGDTEPEGIARREIGTRRESDSAA